VRADLHALWQEVSEHNKAHAVPDGATRITFYFGQVTTEGADEREEGPTAPGAG
jgi:hypothetical protein